MAVIFISNYISLYCNLTTYLKQNAPRNKKNRELGLKTIRNKYHILCCYDTIVSLFIKRKLRRHAFDENKIGNKTVDIE